MSTSYARLDIIKDQSSVLEICYLSKKLQQWRKNIVNNGGQQVALVAIAHLILILCGLFLTIEDIIIQNKPFSMYELTYVLGYFGTQFLLFGSLLIGAVMEKPIWCFPWILIMFIIFSIMSFLWIQSLFVGAASYLLPTVTNVIVLSLVWFGWWTVTKHVVQKYNYIQILPKAVR